MQDGGYAKIGIKQEQLVGFFLFLTFHGKVAT